ncbi:MAG: carboxypeptidase regulatory-like domain-containing protein, partial [Acidobacteria bacterium]|nr:carboxypeptidase regulatory-like domain-containing protein [Acidobacteriota bacterium]
MESLLWRVGSKIRFWGSLALLLLVTLCPMKSMAQALSGITGVVTDQTGAVVPEAKITVTNVSTGVKSFATTSSAGTYTITDLNPGTYTVTIEAAGFQTAQLSNVVV